MKTFFDQYLNEIVGLTVMALMAVALIAGQANAGLQGAAIDDVREVIEIRLIVPE
ncbi:MAG: hypothetical protein OER22_14575 [Gammaproteobacteria bacterium]|nr:hypothetical protein [Gammaproteobacteria bacterium]MDH3374041.1 hypothetical protein [Gammaproteobacteria bacterium]MDH3410046.1 hypothetical protein [Gammaproteobacteria bacterium]MDH3553835.1 hypothetical protein [Gammaproteobacteria bacterium]